MDHGIDAGEELGNPVGRDEPRQDEGGADSQPIEFADQPVAEDAVADPDEPHLGIGLQDGGRDGDEVVVPLELEEPGDRGERHLVVGQPQLAPDLGAGPSRVQERVGIHAAVDGRELLRPADPCRQGLLGHGVANADDGVTARAAHRSRVM